MPNDQPPFAALLRGINVGGHHKVPMAELRALCEHIGCGNVQTYIQSGNVACTFAGSAEQLEDRLERAIEQEFGFSIPVVVRSAAAWDDYVEGNPFAAEAQEESRWVLLVLSKRPPARGAVSELQTRATKGERIALQDDALWVHYAGGIGRSKLTPTALDRCVGSPVTARNWRTVLKLQEMLRDTRAG